MAYRGRLAPSPTGLLHLGHAATFLVAAARARDANGTLVLRNDDLDQQRSRQEFYLAMIEDLRWLGIDWQEGPDADGDYGPYSQSERGDHYLKVWRRLRDIGSIYPCKCSRKDLALAASAPHENADDEPNYPGTCRPQAGAAATMLSEQSSGVNWRFKVPDDEVIAFMDEHFGEQRFVAGQDFGDFLVWRKDDVPSYQLACVADDAAMGITEVVRGADLLKSTARQLLLYRALGLEAPNWYHCDLLTDAKGERLAKRHDALAIRTLREQGKESDEVLALIRKSLGL
ncbi:MAG TPA: tRNA glutamyl-Q(34) synthetase GluQRS [Acidobacteriaceae bacterium]|nr:tRNA glutamyl-Q(34) synthetase GluQRS [Acidobacteriaceae bacterium]